MANKLRDSFDWYGAVAQAAGGIWSSFGNATLNAANTRFGVGQSAALAVNSSNVALQASFSNTTNVVFFTFAHMLNIALTGSLSTSWRFNDTATTQFEIRLSENGSISFYRGTGTLLGTYGGAIPGSGKWVHFQIKIVIDSVNGEFHVRKNGNSNDDYTLTGVNNSGAGTTKVNGITTTGNSLTVPSAQYYDDMWIFDNNNLGDGAPFDWIGDVRSIQIVANSDIVTNLNRSAGALNYANIDELINSLTDYNYSSVPGAYDEYGNAGWGSYNPSQILGLSVRSQMYKDVAGNREGACRIRSGASAAVGPSVAVGTSSTSQPVWYYVDLDPATSAPWSQSGVANLAFGPIVNV